MTIKHWVASVTAAGVLIGGGLTAGALVSSSAGAESGIPGVEGTVAGQGHPMKEVLDGLVADGTLNQDQANKVYDALTAKLKDVRGARQERRADWAADVAGVLGVSADQLKADLKAGQSLSDVAKANGKSDQDVIDGVTAAVKARLDAQVAAGTLTQAQADALLERATVRIERVITVPMPADARRPLGRPGADGTNGSGGSSGSTTSTTAAGNG
jgi:polyhydroxyalkanoate synthesis regulator phasin